RGPSFVEVDKPGESPDQVGAAKLTARQGRDLEKAIVFEGYLPAIFEDGKVIEIRSPHVRGGKRLRLYPFAPFILDLPIGGDPVTYRVRPLLTVDDAEFTLLVSGRYISSRRVFQYLATNGLGSDRDLVKRILARPRVLCLVGIRDAHSQESVTA